MSDRCGKRDPGMGLADGAAGTAGGGLRSEAHQGLLWPGRLSSCGVGRAGKEALELERKTASFAEGGSESDEQW